MAFLLILLPFICSIYVKRANISMLLLLICLICNKWGKRAIKKTPPKRGLVLICPCLNRAQQAHGSERGGVTLVFH